MSEVVIHQPHQTLDLQSQMDYSKALAAASIIPKAYQNQPANILVAIGYAQALGEHPIAALTDVYVVEGRPSMSASMMHRRAMEAGHRVRVTSTDTEAAVSIWRKDDPQYEYKIVWTLDRAQHAGLMGRKGPWQTYPAAMLRSRAVSEACRVACPEVLGAVKYTPEELGGDFTDVPSAPTQPSGPTTKVSRRKPKAEPDVVDAVVEDAPESVDADTHGQDELREAIARDVITDAQMKKLCALLTENGIDVKAYGPMSQIVGRDITSKTDLSKTEAARLIDSLETRLTQESN